MIASAFPRGLQLLGPILSQAIDDLIKRFRTRLLQFTDLLTELVKIPQYLLKERNLHHHPTTSNLTLELLRALWKALNSIKSCQ